MMMFQQGGPDFGGGLDFGGDGADGVGEGGEGIAQGPSEQQREQAEAAAAARFAAQKAAVAQLKKEEKKTKKDDSKIADIIIRFLNDSSHTKFFILIARLVSRNVPSSFILSILALVDEECAKEANFMLPVGNFQQNQQLQSGQTGLQAYKGAEFKSLPPEIKKTIDSWTQNIYKVGNPHAKKIILSLLNPDKSLEDAIFQLPTFVLQEFLSKREIQNEYQDVRQFMEVVMKSILKKYKEVMDGEKKLESGNATHNQ